MNLSRFIMMFICVFIGNATAIARPITENGTEKYFNSIQNNPQKLYHFLYQMPKGGDLHNHASGATYAENMIAYAAKDHLCVDRKTYIVTNNSNCAAQDDFTTAVQDVQFKDALIDAWSMRHFHPDTESGHDHFFSTFGKFGFITGRHSGEVLAEIAQRAELQNELYLELMTTPDGNESGRLGKSLGWDDDLTRFRNKLLSSGLDKIVNSISINLDQSEANMRSSLHCDSRNLQAGCSIKIRYLYQILREQPPEMVFAQLLAGFESASHDTRIVGINMVQPEDGKLSMRDYKLHMQMVGFLHRLYPTVAISLHAGELTDSLVPAEGLTFHIRDAIDVAHANRIGHGVDILQENNADQLLKTMAQQHNLVEINLSSNTNILKVEGKNHPLSLYMGYGVPVTLSTDDEGVSRSNLTKEYQQAVLTYHFPYSVIKTFVRNSIFYGFLQGKSLWTDYSYRQIAPRCAKDSIGSEVISMDCQAFLKTNEKAAMQWELEKRFIAFEERFERTK